MKTKNYQLFADILDIVLLYLVVVSVDNIILCATERSVYWPEYIVIFAVLFYSALLRVNVKRIVPFLVLDALLLASAVFVPMMVDVKIRAIMFAIIVVIFNLHYLSNNSGSGIISVPHSLGIVIIVAYITAIVRGFPVFAVYEYVIGVLFVVFAALKVYMRNAYYLGVSGQITEQMPVREIYRNSTLVISGIVGIVAAAMAFFKADRLISFLGFIWDYIAYFIGMILEWILGPETHSENEPIPHAKAPAMVPVKETEAGWFLKTIEAVILVVCTVLLIYIIYKAVKYFIDACIHKEHWTGRQKVFDAGIEVRERIAKEKIDDEAWHFGKRTNEEKVRVVYKKRMLSLKRSGIDIGNNKTTFEHKELVRKSKGLDISQSTKIYENVRYNNDYSATSKDVEAIRSAIKAERKDI